MPATISVSERKPTSVKPPALVATKGKAASGDHGMNRSTAGSAGIGTVGSINVLEL